MGEKIRKLWLFSWTETEAAEAYLAAQAAKGLLLQELRTVWATGNIGVIAVFERSVPQKRTYCIDMMRTETEEEAETYLRLAEDAGWKPVTSVSGVVVYVSEEGKTPVALQTDWKSKYRLVRKTFWSFEIPVAVGACLVSWLLLLLKGPESSFSIFLGDPVRSISAIILLMMVCLGIFCGVRTISYYIASQLAIVRNCPMKPKEMRVAMWSGAFLHGLCLLTFTGITLMVLRMIALDVLAGGMLKKVSFALMCLTMAGMVGVLHLRRDRNGKSYRNAVVIVSVLMVVCAMTYISTGIEIG